jgi:hypothetical protein
MYNVLEKLRANEELTVEDHATYEMGLIGLLRQIHNELDEAVFAAYGWSSYAYLPVRNGTANYS